eukprot:CAMPEP_0118701462 /NCGR_PEP_ID=MMETSP0800-20121206/17267_1 /TAXON_ID=210618 ORGANISM="Striatella unipunctata, Strain CCMP2910" /NCGR_SAMPLE_ID=MMETSP0800 /ASSEMBLY_ACC=CAM_ASM_000638 /LENGTH=319 /DNA_ID=CAMNT_0006602391 /DNA_START=313 /DNA_END=1272 /DNA_ORIENTATION=-
MSSIATDINGKAIASKIRQEIKEEILSFEEDQVPGLAVLLVGSRRDSQTYVRMKKKACEECSIASFGYTYNDTVTQTELINDITKLNEDPKVHGILVQLPLPVHINESAVLHAINPEKDVDGLHPMNVASLCHTNTHIRAAGESAPLDWKNLTSVPFSIPCTPLGCIELLDRSGVSIAGKNAVVIGRSNLVGMPVSLLLMHRDATVTIVHSKTKNPKEVVKNADIVVVAVGRAHFVQADWIKAGAVVIDVGINSVDAPETKKGYKLVGDVMYDTVREVASMITPVPGGVGPMTIAMLLRNTLYAAKRTNNIEDAPKEAS